MKEKKEDLKKMSLPDTSYILPNPHNGVERVNQPITDFDGFDKYFNEVTKNNLRPFTNKLFCVMQFYREDDLYVPTDHDHKPQWINTKNSYFHNGAQALMYYADTPCEHSQLLDATSTEELAKERNQMLLNFQDEQWLAKNIYQD